MPIYLLTNVKKCREKLYQFYLVTMLIIGMERYGAQAEPQLLLEEDFPSSIMLALSESSPLFFEYRSSADLARWLGLSELCACSVWSRWRLENGFDSPKTSQYQGRVQRFWEQICFLPYIYQTVENCFKNN